jgi:hypothetical protein
LHDTSQIILRRNVMAGYAAFSSMSGIDITAMVGETVVGTLTGISYSITREKAPVR